MSNPTEEFLEYWNGLYGETEVWIHSKLWREALKQGTAHKEGEGEDARLFYEGKRAAIDDGVPDDGVYDAPPWRSVKRCIKIWASEPVHKGYHEARRRGYDAEWTGGTLKYDIPPIRVLDPENVPATE